MAHHKDNKERLVSFIDRVSCYRGKHGKVMAKIMFSKNSCKCDGTFFHQSFLLVLK